MDYHTMKRRQLQALCKEHNIPANSANSVMAHKLSQLLNEKQKPTTQQRTCLKSPVDLPVEGEPAVSKRKAKKVGFSPNNYLIEYELRPGKKQKDVVAEMKGRRKSVANKADKQVVSDNNNTVELIDDGTQIPVKLTRSRAQVSGKDDVIQNNEKKKGRKAAKDVEKITDVVKEPEGNLGKVTRSKVRTLNKGAVAQLDEKQSKLEIKDVKKTTELVEGAVIGHVRVTRSKAQSLMEDGMGSDVNPQLKKSSGRRVAKDAHGVEPSREIRDIPVRVTRTRGQILKEDIGNTVTNPQGEKKRTRKEMKSTDLRFNLSNVAPDDNQELPKRKSLRTRGVETPDDDEAENLGRGKPKKRSKESVAEVPESRHQADNGLRQSRRNVAKVEDSKVLNQNVGKVEIFNDKKVARSKHQRESKLVQQLEEPSDHGEKKVVNRRKSVMQKAQGKGIDKPLVGKMESLKATVMVESPTRETRKTVGKTWSKKQSGNLSLIDEGIEDVENVTISGKDVSENEIKAVVNATQSPKSRKRRGTPIVEDQTVETKYVSPVDESPRHSAPSSSRSEGKSVAKKQSERSLKTPASRKNNQLALQHAFLEVNKENSSRKRAKLSGINQRDSKNRSEKSNVKGTPVPKLGNFELEEEVTETESTPAIESHRQVTRSAIRTVGKEPIHSVIKEQPIGDAPLSSQKAARFRPDPAVNTAPGRVTRSGIKHGGKAAFIFSEKVDKKKQLSQSALRKQPVETEYVSPVDESPRHSAPSSSRSEGKSVAKKLVESSLKTPASRKKNQLAVQNSFLEVKKENSSRKIAKLSGINQRDSENHSEKSNVKGTPVPKLGNFELEEEVIETESTTAIESHRRVTLGKEPSQSAIKEQPIGDAQFSSRKAARFRPDPAVNTAPGRVTRSGIKHGGRAAIIFSEKVDKKKQLSQSALQKQPLDDTQISSPEGAEVGLSTDVDTTGVHSEISKASESVKLPTIVPEENMVSFTGTAIVIENLSPVSGENAYGVESHIISDIIPVTMAEKPEVYETTPDTVSDGSHVQNETQEVSVKFSIFSEAEVQVALNSEKPAAYENEMDLTKLGSMSKGLQIDLMAEEPAISVDKTVVMEENVDILYEVGSSAVCHVSVEQSDVKGKSEETEDQVEPSIIENVTQFIEDDGSYAQIAKGSEQDDLTCKDSLQNDSVDKHEGADNGEGDDEDESDSVQKPLMNESVSEDRVAAVGVDAQKMDESDNKEDIISAGQSVNEHGELSTGKSVVNCLAMDRSGVADVVDVTGKDPTKKLEFEVTDNDVKEVLILGENDLKEDIVSQSIAEHGELLTGNDVHEISIFVGSDNKEDIVSAGQGVAAHGELSAGNDVHEILILGGSDNKEDIVSAGQSVAEHGEMSTGVHEILILGESDNKEDMVTAGQSVAKHGELSTGKKVIYVFSMDRSDVADDVVDAGKAPTKKLEFEVRPPTGNDVHEVPILGNSDGEDEGANATKEGEIDSMPSTDGDMLEYPVWSGSNNDGGVNAIDCDTASLPSTAGNKLEDSLLSGNDGEDEITNATDCQIDSLPSTSGNMIEDPVLSGIDSKAESNPKSLTDHDVSDTSFLGKDDYNINRQLEPTLELSPADDIIESPFSGNDNYDDVEDDGGINVPKELETGLEPSNVPVSINDVNSDFENDQLTSNDSHAMDDHNVGDEDSEPAPNESTPVVTEVSINSCDQELEQVFNVTADDIPCDTVGICASVGPSDSSTNIEAPYTHAIEAITVDPLVESTLDINKEALSSILGDTYDTDTENDSGDKRKSTELGECVQPKETESFSPDMSKEQTSEKAEVTTRNDLELDDQEEHTVETVDLDLDGVKFMKECSNHGVEELNSELVGIINADENPTREEISPFVQTEEPTVDGIDSSQVMGDIVAHESMITKGSSPITYTHEKSPLVDSDSDSPIYFKEDDGNKQGSITVDWGDYSFPMDEFHNPVIDDVLDKNRTEFQTSVGVSSLSEKNSSVAADMVNSVKNLEMASRNVTNEKSSQEVDMLKENENADMIEEVFNWSDSSLKSLLKAPVATQLSNVKDDQEEGVSFSNQDHCTFVDGSGSFTFSDDRCNKDIAKSGTATHGFDHQWQMEPLGGFDGETQGNAITHSSEYAMYGTPNIGDYSHKFFGDEVDDPSDDGSGKDKHFNFKGDQVDRTKQFDLSSGAVGTSRHHASVLKDNSVFSDVLEKEEGTQLKGPEPFDDLDFDKGM